MRNWPSDPFSAIFQDEDGHRLVAVFASRLPADYLDSPLTDLSDDDDDEPVSSQVPSSPLTSLSGHEDDDSDEGNAEDEEPEVASEAEDEEPEVASEAEDSEGEEQTWEDDDLELTKVPVDKPTVRLNCEHYFFAQKMASEFVFDGTQRSSRTHTGGLEPSQIKSGTT